MQNITLTIDKLVHGGQALGKTDDGKACFVWNALPGETVEARMVKNKKTHIDAIGVDVKTPSPDRTEPKQPHFLSSSPWDIMTYDAELLWKKTIAIEAYEKIGKLGIGDTNIQTDHIQYGYRNKMEYSFAEKDGAISLALYARGGHERIPIEPDVLASDAINNAAEHILDWVNEQQIPIRSFKSLIIRSNADGDTIAALFIKDELSFDTFPALASGLIGFELYYSTHKSPASVPTKRLYTNGTNIITETVRGTKLQSGIFSFFQVNTPMFEMVLEDIIKHIPKDKPLLDFYSGVGSIGLPIAHHVPHLELVEANADATDFAQKNIQENTLTHVTAHCSLAENIQSLISPERTLILDPPRAGLHPDVTKHIIEQGPQTVIYMSCNPATHARDLGLLSKIYDISSLTLYNFFPRTPHIEALAILTKK